MLLLEANGRCPSLQGVVAQVVTVTSLSGPHAYSMPFFHSLKAFLKGIQLHSLLLQSLCYTVLASAASSPAAGMVAGAIWAFCWAESFVIYDI